MRAAGGTRGWRRVAVGAAALLVGATGTPVAARAAPTPGADAATPVCAVRDRRLIEISGLAAIDGGYAVVNDGADDESRRRIFFLGPDCRVVRDVPYPSRPRDTEDLAVTADGTVWVADVGDNDRSRTTVAVWKLPPGAARPVLHRLTYPDGPHDAEALLVTGDGRPVVVTKFSGALYAPTTAPRPGATVPLARVGQVRLPATTTSNPFGILGRGAITGAATAPDGSRVVLRTYADAFEFDVTGGDVIAALTTGTPRTTALPDEPQGESITYDRDGRSLLTVSETADQPPGTAPRILRYPLAGPAAAPPGGTPEPTSTPTDAATGADPTAAVGAGRRGGDVHPAVPLAAAALVLGAVVVAGLVALRRIRRR
ncbi:hypothetical protein ACFOOK_30470 [Micromonospora krabiensis]|uniref:Esterase-like activity of phytase n=1 Tax=Micromonospora krabiensis TaxID=307121 RepID=A0A1C3N2Z1_9ACTN|nr:hypothetical protein [Micromonospora krabiensis]SBV26953.1 hypothetical protein GA0070620_2450 [Micromonospora krabiensis]